MAQFRFSRIQSHSSLLYQTISLCVCVCMHAQMLSNQSIWEFGQHSWCTDCAVGCMSKASAPFLARVTDLYFLFHKTSRPTLGPTQPPTEAGPGHLSLGIKQRGCEAYHSPHLMQKLGMSVAISSHTPTSFHGTYRDDLTQWSTTQNTWLINLNFLYKKQTQNKNIP